jgi:hypothetical protein
VRDNTAPTKVEEEGFVGLFGSRVPLIAKMLIEVDNLAFVEAKFAIIGYLLTY